VISSVDFTLYYRVLYVKLFLAALTLAITGQLAVCRGQQLKPGRLAETSRSFSQSSPRISGDARSLDPAQRARCSGRPSGDGFLRAYAGVFVKA